MKQMKSERGQIIVLFVFGLIALLALTALAIDGAMLYSTRRYDQGVADSSALAGASVAAQKMDNLGVKRSNFNCTSANVATVVETAKTAAIERAATNHFTLDDDISDQLGVSVTCGVSGFIQYLDIKVMISSDVQTALVQLFYSGTPRTTVEAVSRIRPRTALGYGYGIASTSTNCNTNAANPEGVIFNGGINVYVNGSGVFSNSCMQPSNGQICTGEIPEGMTFASEEERQQYICSHPGIVGNNYMAGQNPCPDPDDCNISPVPQPGGESMPAANVPPPDCSAVAGYDAHLTQKGAGTISPGNYDEITTNNQALTMQPGLYCLYDKGITLKGDVMAKGVTIYLVNTGMLVSAGGVVDMEAPQMAADPAIKGMLVYMAYGNNSTVDLSGNSNSKFLGTIYAPDGVIKVSGNPGETPTFNTELIAKGVSISGNAYIDINYRDHELYSDPPQLDLFQ